MKEFLQPNEDPSRSEATNAELLRIREELYRGREIDPPTRIIVNLKIKAENNKNVFRTSYIIPDYDEANSNKVTLFTETSVFKAGIETILVNNDRDYLSTKQAKELQGKHSGKIFDNFWLIFDDNIVEEDLSIEGKEVIKKIVSGLEPKEAHISTGANPSLPSAETKRLG